MTKPILFAAVMSAFLVSACGDDDTATDTGVDTATDTGGADTTADDTGSDDVGADTSDAAMPGRDASVWVAARGAGEIIVIDHASQALTTVTMPDTGEPMYANFIDLDGGFVAVGDRANDRVTFFDANTRAPAGMVSVADGVFHQWVNGNTFAVNADVANETHVFTLTVEDGAIVAAQDGVIAMPSDLAATDGAKPHDVFLADDGGVFVTYIGFEMSSFVVRFDEADGSFSETARAEVGGDSHLYLLDDLLYVPCQDSSEVHVLAPATLASQAVLAVPGAHGVTANNGIVYVANINAPESTVIAQISGTALVEGLAMVRPPATAIGAPHNVWFGPDGVRAYLTHSGGDSTFVSTYTVTSEGLTADAAPIDVGAVNPFGLTLVP